MMLTDDILVRYVDGQLPAADHATVEAALARDHVAAERVRLMRISGAALTIERDRALPPLDATLLDRALSGPTSAPRTAWLAPVIPNWSRIAAMAAGLALLIGFGGGWLAHQTVAPAKHLPVWVMRVVDYHTLYARETVDGRTLGQGETAALEQRFASLLGQPVAIPTFGAELELRRGQVLQFEQEPIIQLAYLPNEGMPVALCFKRAAGPDTPPDYRRVSGIGMVRWRQNDHEFVLVGEQSEALLRRVAQRSLEQIGQRRQR